MSVNHHYHHDYDVDYPRDVKIVARIMFYFFMALLVAVVGFCGYMIYAVMNGIY